MRYCLTCGKELSGKRLKSCSADCTKRRWYEKNVVIHQLPKTERTCAFCEKSFIPNSRFHQHNKTRFCSKKCREKEAYQRNKKIILARSKKWRQENPDKEREIHRNYYAKNSLRVRVLKRARNTAHIKISQWIEICEVHGNMCCHCEKIGDYRYFSIDHIIPAVHGGSNETWNLQPLCLRCNQVKGSRWVG